MRPPSLRLVHIPSELGDAIQSVEGVVASLMEEAPGTLQDLVVGEWRVAGCKLTMPPAVAAATKRYLDEQDPLVAWIEPCCVPGRAPSDREEQTFPKWYASFRQQSGRAEEHHQRARVSLVATYCCRRVVPMARTVPRAAATTSGVR